MAVDELSYDARHGVVVCRQCRTCLSPDGPRQWRRHLRREPHGLKDERLARAVRSSLSTYTYIDRDIDGWMDGCVCVCVCVCVHVYVYRQRYR